MIRFTMNNNLFIILPSLTYFFQVHPFSTPSKHQIPMFSGDRDRVHWEQIGLTQFCFDFPIRFSALPYSVICSEAYW